MIWRVFSDFIRISNNSNISSKLPLWILVVPPPNIFETCCVFIAYKILTLIPRLPKFFRLKWICVVVFFFKLFFRQMKNMGKKLHCVHYGFTRQIIFFSVDIIIIIAAHGGVLSGNWLWLVLFLWRRKLGGPPSSHFFRQIAAYMACLLYYQVTYMMSCVCFFQWSIGLRDLANG